MKQVSVVRVSGKCREAVEEEICAYLNVPVKQITWHPMDEVIHIELRECTGITAAILTRWSSFEICHNGSAYCLQDLVFGRPIVHWSPHGAHQEDGLAVAVRFTKCQRIN